MASHTRDVEPEKVKEQVAKGMVSKACAQFTTPGIAQATPEVLDYITDPARRPMQQQRPIPEHAPTLRLELDRKLMAQNIRNIKRGTAPGRSGLRGEHLRVFVESVDDDGFELFVKVMEKLANADVPAEVIEAVRLGALTPLNKKDEHGEIVGYRASAQETHADA